jgi:hypothetical protein
MESPAELLALVAFFALVGFGALVLGPIGRAFAERLRRKGIEPAINSAELDALRDEVAGLRQQVGELAERQDFTERLLGQVRERGLLQAPKERQGA